MKTKTIFYILGVSAILLVVIALVQDFGDKKKDAEMHQWRREDHSGIPRGSGSRAKIVRQARHDVTNMLPRPGEGPEAPLSLLPHM